MGLKLFVSIFVILLILGNVFVFFFVSGVNLIDKIKAIVLSYIGKYIPLADPLLIFLLLSFTAIIIIVIVMLKVLGGGSGAGSAGSA